MDCLETGKVRFSAIETGGITRSTERRSRGHAAGRSPHLKCKSLHSIPGHRASAWQSVCLPFRPRPRLTESPGSSRSQLLSVQEELFVGTVKRVWIQGPFLIGPNLAVRPLGDCFIPLSLSFFIFGTNASCKALCSLRVCPEGIQPCAMKNRDIY